MTKAAIWNQLKTEYEYSSSFLNKLYGVTYQQASKELLESILEQLQKEVGQGVKENLGSQCGGGTVVPVKENAVNLPDTINNLITDTNQDEVNSSNINQSAQTTETTIVATVTSDNKFKGIPVEHFNFKHEAYIDSMLKCTEGVLISKYLGTHAVSFNDGEQRKSDITLLEAVKVANEWLGGNTVKVPSTEESLTPKIELFAKFTEFTYLANCLKYLIERMLDANVENAKQLNKEAIIFSNNVFDSWFCISEICFNYVVKVPLLTYKTRHQLTTLIPTTLERKSIYA